MPEIIIVSDAVESTDVDLDGKSHREQAEAKLSRREREVPGEDGEEINKSEKESDSSGIRRNACLRKRSSAEQEEVEERIFVPSAVSVLQKMMFRCDKQCSEKSLSYWQLASVVINEREESYTTNICLKCFNNSLKQQEKKH